MMNMDGMTMESSTLKVDVMQKLSTLIRNLSRIFTMQLREMHFLRMLH